MDGHFVPNLSMGAEVVRALRPITKLPLEVHLMVEDPTRFAEGFVKAGADTLIFHLEVLDEPRPLLAHIRRNLKIKAGLAFNPDMAVERIEPFLGEIDLALCMTVFPGFGGQGYIPASTKRIEQLRKLIDTRKWPCELEVDGGIDTKTIGLAARAGANVFVAGTSIYGSKDGATTALNELRKLASGG